MERFRTGNVVRLHERNLVIITNHSRTIKLIHSQPNYDVTDWVDFNHENCSGSTNKVSYIEKDVYCHCDDDPDCKTCKGTGRYECEVHGMDKATFEASCVKDYIMKGLTKNFNF